MRSCTSLFRAAQQYGSSQRLYSLQKVSSKVWLAQFASDSIREIRFAGDSFPQEVHVFPLRQRYVTYVAEEFATSKVHEALKSDLESWDRAVSIPAERRLIIAVEIVADPRHRHLLDSYYSKLEWSRDSGLLTVQGFEGTHPYRCEGSHSDFAMSGIAYLRVIILSPEKRTVKDTGRDWVVRTVIPGQPLPRLPHAHKPLSAWGAHLIQIFESTPTEPVVVRLPHRAPSSPPKQPLVSENLQPAYPPETAIYRLQRRISTPEASKLYDPSARTKK